jgi:hypothetical protein
MLYGRLPTAEYLHLIGLRPDELCQVCHLHVETVEHASFECRAASLVLLSISAWIGSHNQRINGEICLDYLLSATERMDDNRVLGLCTMSLAGKCGRQERKANFQWGEPQVGNHCKKKSVIEFLNCMSRQGKFGKAMECNQPTYKYG